ncbi:hypothetical protein LP7551_04967 [Roseibium album]|nr:hypothetical protein LP7551_04967 [Roseibium album]
MSGTDDTGSDFWSRRKAAVRKAEDADKAEQEAVAQSELQEKQAEKSDEEILAELGLPDPDTLSEEDDFSRFLSTAIPERLRRRALRRLWGLNPVLANLDGLIDYGEDFTDAATVVSDLQTVYQVGKGMFDKFAEVVNEEEQADPEVPELSISAADESSTTSIDKDNDATHNDYIQKGKGTIHLTQGDDFVQSDNEGAVHLDLISTAPVEADEEPHLTRRRIRFDYS